MSGSSFSITWKEFSMVFLKNIVFIVTLLYTGYHDQKTTIIPNFVHLLIMISSLLADFKLVQSLLGLLILPIPFIIPIFYDENSMGGGDIKLVAAIGFFLGIIKGTTAIIIGLFLSLIVAVFILKKGKKDFIPLGPYFAAGSIITLLL